MKTTFRDRLRAQLEHIGLSGEETYGGISIVLSNATIIFKFSAMVGYEDLRDIIVLPNVN